MGRPKLAAEPATVKALRQQGLSWKQISRQVGASVRTVRRRFAIGQDSQGINTTQTTQNSISGISPYTFLLKDFRKDPITIIRKTWRRLRGGTL